MARWFDRLSVRLIGSHVALVALMACLIAALVMTAAEDALRDAVGDGRRQVARRTADEVRQVIEGPVATLRAAAIAMNVEREAWQRQSILSQIRLGVPVLDEVSLVDTHGVVHATSMLDLNGDIQAGSELPDRYRDMTHLLAAVREKGTGLTSVDVQDGRPGLIIAMAVEEGRHVTGMLVATLRLSMVWRRLNSVGEGQTGRAVLLNEDGTIVSHPDQQVVFARQMHPAFVAAMGVDDGWLLYSDSQDVEWIAGHAKVEGVPWHVVVEQQTSEALALVRLMQVKIAVIVGTCLLGAILLGIKLLRSIGKPVEELTQAVRRYHAGDEGDLERLPTGEGGEIGELSTAFRELGKVVHDRRLMEHVVMQQEKLAALGEMGAGLAHEIKNPLAIMRGAADLMKRLNPNDAAEREDALATLESAIERCDAQVRRLLDFARLSGEGDERIDIGATMDQIVELLGHRMRDAGVTVETDYVADTYVSANRDTMKDVFLNIITNGLDAMPDGGTLSLSTKVQQDIVQAEIADSGTGMPASVAERIFDPFFTTKPGVGTGLGLAVGYRQIREAGGDIRVYSVEGEGTVFRVDLPQSDAQADGEND